MINYLTVDLESWAYPNLPEYNSLASEERKILDNGHVRDSTKLILKILKKYGKKVTFFIVGQLFEWYPEIIEMIARNGHEVAYHTYEHEVLNSESVLEKSLIKSEKFLKKFKPFGFRAPRVNFRKGYLKILRRFGFKYDSSIYGKYESRFKAHGIYEFPVTSYGKMPIGSGYFTGLLGDYISHLYKKLNSKNIPFIAFLHNWQILTPVKPSFPTKKYLLTHPHYFPYLKNTLKTFEYLLEEFEIAPMKNLIE